MRQYAVHRNEPLGAGIVRCDLTGVYLVNEAVDLKRAFGKAGSNSRMCFQVIELGDHVLFSEKRKQVLRRKSAIVMPEDLARRVCMMQPALRVWQVLELFGMENCLH